MTATAQKDSVLFAFNILKAMLILEAELLAKYNPIIRGDRKGKREFDRQYTDFIINQNHYRRHCTKRQKELQLLMDNNVGIQETEFR